MIVNRLAETADPAGTPSQTGNGRLNLDRALNDGSTTSIEPAGAPPSGDGGPFVGPYVIANKNLSVTIMGTGTGTVAIADTTTPANNMTCTATCTDSTANNDVGTLTATASAGSMFAGWSGSFVSGGTTTCTGTATPCSFAWRPDPEPDRDVHQAALDDDRGDGLFAVVGAGCWVDDVHGACVG